MTLELYAPRRNLVLAASAGTGKTHTLVGVIIHLLVAGPGGIARPKPVDPARVVATTFSRKAAAEIRGRVTTELERLAADPTTSIYAASLRERGLRDDAMRAAARRAASRIAAARFGTLHGFATGIVRSYAVELRLGGAFELASEADVRARVEDAIALALEEQLVSHPDAVHSLAEAAGGIDRLVLQIRRVLTQLEEDGRPARSLALPERDAAVIEARVREAVSHARDLAGVGRFEEPSRALLAAWDAGDVERIEDALAAQLAVPMSAKKTPELEAFAAFRKDLPGATNEEKGRRLGRAYRARHLFVARASVIREVLGAVEERIEAARGSMMGFGAVLRAARGLLRDRPEIAEEIATGIDALLVDEFQDTSRVQRDLLQLLWAVPEAREVGTIPRLSTMRDRGLLVVGDRKQSIYGFRGADVGVFAELAVGLAGAAARDALGIPAGVTWEPRQPIADFHALRHNRRSVSAILSFANAFSARRFRAADVPAELYEIEYVPSTEDLLVAPEHGSTPGAATPRTTWLRVRPKGNTSTRIEEALVVARRIARLLDEDDVRVGRDSRKASLRDVAVLAATNGMLDAMAFALAQADLPYVVAGKSFFRAREIRDLAAMLGLVLDPADRRAALEVLRGPWAGAHDTTLLALSRPGDGLLPVHAWRSPVHPELVRKDDRPSVEAVCGIVLALAECAGRLGPATILREAIRALAFEDVLSALPRGEQRVANVRKLLAIADRHTDTRQFRAWLDAASEQEMPESEAATFSEDDDAIRLLTVHASKGLDFPIVFFPETGAGPARLEKGAVRIVVGTGDSPNVLAVRIAGAGGMILEPPSFTSAYADTRRRDRAERQRLAYVAVTRAADALFLVGGRARQTASDPGASSLSVLEELASDGGAVPSAALTVEEVDPPTSAAAFHVEDGPRLRPPPSSAHHGLEVPKWRSLAIAPTALADFDHCPRRFELVHVLGFPEHGRLRQGGTGRTLGSLDARAQGTLAHAALEEIPAASFGAASEADVSAVLERLGVPIEHPDHGAIQGRVLRFLNAAYARAIRGDGAEIQREVGFVLPVSGPEGREVVLRGSIDLLVTWRDGSIDVVDYKSARGGSVTEYAFQLDVYALAARAARGVDSRVRTGLVFLGSGSGEPMWREPEGDREIRERIAALGDGLVSARWTQHFVRVPLPRCEAIHCGFIGRCHASSRSDSTEANPSRATTT